jgi:hypothetical protein
MRGQISIIAARFSGGKAADVRSWGERAGP